jgi:hypothetical protein
VVFPLNIHKMALCMQLPVPFAKGPCPEVHHRHVGHTPVKVHENVGRNEWESTSLSS